MDGLECKEVCKSELERTLRIDSEFYSKNYVEIYNMLSSLAHKPLTAYVDVSDGNHMGISEHFSDEGTDISNGYIESDNSIFIDPTGFSKFVSSGDILTGRVGTIGKFGVVDETLSGALCSDNILCFHLPEAYMPNVYALYFNNPIIKSLITRLARGSVQQRLNQETLREVLVPYINDSVQTLIDQKVASSFNLREKSEHILAIVIRTVEMAIEQGEDAALAWLKDKVVLSDWKVEKGKITLRGWFSATLKLQQGDAEAIENGTGSVTTEDKSFDFSITLDDDFKIATDKESQKEIIEIKLQGS